MRKLVMLALVISVSGSLFAQWGDNCSSPTQITSAQYLYYSDVCIASNGDIYFAWMESVSGSSSLLQFCLKKYDSQGLPLWASPVIVCYVSIMGTPEQCDLVMDNDGNIVIVFTKFRLITSQTGTNDIYIYKVSPTGALLWNSIQLNDDSSLTIVNFFPTLTCTTQNNIAVAWQRNAGQNSLRVKVLNPNGNIISGCSVAGDSCDYETPKLMASDNGCFLLQYFEDTDDANTAMYVNKYDPNAEPVWTLGAVAIQNLGSIIHQTYYPPYYVDLASDAAGGMFLAWSDDRDGNSVRNAYVQHIQTDGSLAFTPNGTLISSDAIYSQKDARICYDAASGHLYAFANVDNNIWHIPMQLVAQKFNASGQALWGDPGLYFLQAYASPVNPIRALFMQDRFYMFYDCEIGDQPNYDDTIMVTGLNASGTSVLLTPEVLICNTIGYKNYINAASEGNFAVLCWTNHISNIMYAMRLNANGSLGYQVLEPAVLQAEVVNGTSVHLTWQGVVSNLPGVVYRVYQNGVMVGQTWGNNQQFIVTHPGLEQTTTYDYYVTAYWYFGFESLPSNRVTITITANQDSVDPPTILALTACPNPFPENVNLSFTRKDPKLPLRLCIYNLKGQLVRSFQLSADANELTWDGRDGFGNESGSGIYLLKLQQGSESALRKVLKTR